MRSFRLSITPKRRAAARFVGQVRRSLQKALADNPDINQAGIARALEVDRSVITKQLNGEGNISLSRVGELAWAMGVEPELILRKPASKAGDNHERQVPAATVDPLHASGSRASYRTNFTVVAGAFSDTAEARTFNRAKETVGA